MKMPSRLRSAGAIALLAMAATIACGGSTAPAPASSGSPAVDPATAGTITGRVVVEGTPPKAQTSTAPSVIGTPGERMWSQSSAKRTTTPTTELRRSVVECLSTK